jgi:hypothetical protein
VENAASEAALLSSEQLQSLSKAARIFGKGMEEVTRDVTNYLKQLQDLLPMALEAATREAVVRPCSLGGGGSGIWAVHQRAGSHGATSHLLW